MIMINGNVTLNLFIYFYVMKEEIDGRNVLYIRSTNHDVAEW